MTLHDLMFAAIEKRASDIHLKVNDAPILRIDGELVRVPGWVLSEKDVMEMLATIASPADVDNTAVPE